MVKKELLEELGIEEEDIKRIKKSLEKKEVKEKEKEKVEKTNFFVVVANTIFRGIALNLAKKQFFQQYKIKLRKADIPLILSSYLSLMFFVTAISFIFFLTFAIFLSLKASAAVLIRNIVLCFVGAFMIFVIIFFYPDIKIKNEERKIEAELPFAALYMASISSAGVQPVKVLELIANSKEYVAVAKQMRKVTNQIKFFGMDVVSAIKATNSIIANKHLAELLNGIATNIVTGGNLKNYFEEQAKRAMTDYKIKREKFTESAGIYSDIYTGLLIAAPLIFMLVLVLVNAFGGTVMGLSPMIITIFGIVGLIILNIIFIIYLQIVTPPI